MYRLYIFIMLLIAGCHSIYVVQPSDVSVDIRLTKVHIKDRLSEGYLKIYEFTDFPGIVNEIYLPDGSTLVEYFDTPDGAFVPNQRDKHSVDGLTGSYKRYVYTYPAEVTGVDATSNGFAELPMNKDGSVVTTTNPLTFNVVHNRAHRRTGYVVADDRESGRWWSITMNSDGSYELKMDDKPRWAS